MSFKNIGLAIFSVILFFAVLEIGCRIFKLEVNTGEEPSQEAILRFKISNTQDHRDVFLETGPRIHPLSEYNRAGFSNEKEGYTILSIGDSCVYGLGVDKDQTFSYYLEEILNKKSFPKKTRVYNFGWPGYASSQGVLFLKKYIKELDPDMIIAWFGANDGCYAPFFSDAQYLRKKDGFLIRLHNHMYTNFRSYRILKNINFYFIQAMVDKSFKDPLTKNNKRKRVSPEEFRHNLSEMENISQNNNSKIIFVWHSWLFDGRLEKHGLYKPSGTVLDIADIYASKPDKPDNFFADHCHPSSSGHKVIAEALAERMFKETDKIAKH